jgi:hypothetical protein
MSSNKKGSSKRQTKAGMLDKAEGSEARSEEAERSNDAAETTPKISKDKAAKRDGDKPAH